MIQRTKILHASGFTLCNLVSSYLVLCLFGFCFLSVPFEVVFVVSLVAIFVVEVVVVVFVMNANNAVASEPTAEGRLRGWSRLLVVSQSLLL